MVGLIDIDTTLTLLSVPLVDPLSKKKVGAFQVIYSRGVDGIRVVKKGSSR